MLDREHKQIRQRILLVVMVFISLFGFLLFHSYTLQVVKGDQFHARASRQTMGSIVLEPRRGEIRDRQGRVLAGTREVPSLGATPAKMANAERGQAIEILMEAYGGAPAFLDLLTGNSPFVWLDRRISEERAEAVRNALDKHRVEGLATLNKVFLRNEDMRVYPGGMLAANLMGHADIDLKGQAGLEKQFNEDLAGDTIRYKGVKTGMGEVTLETLDELLDIPAGNDIILTLDKTAQYISEREIRMGVTEHKAEWGVAVVLDPKDGGILAMAQWPSFDPNDLTGTPPSHIHNFAVEWTYEPGSTMKPLPISTAMDMGMVSAEQKIWCNNGLYVVGPKKIHDTHQHGWLTVREILYKSSNIGTAKIAQQMGIPLVYKSLTDYGIGMKTGITLPIETKGLLAKPETWMPIELVNRAFGQGVNVTPLQMAAAYGAIANGGQYMKPRLVDRVVGPDGKIVKRFEPTAVRRVISEETSRELREILIQAVSDEGTGSKARFTDSCAVGGKTGTAEKLAKNLSTGRREFWTSSFVGFLPAEDPKLVILVVVDEPRNGKYYGGEVAAPVFRAIASELAPMYGICSKRIDLAFKDRDEMKTTEER